MDAFLERNLPALIVVVPLLGGILSAMLGKRRTGWWIAMGASALVLAGCLELLARVLAAPGGRIEYLMSNWPVPYGIAFAIDSLNGAVLVIIAAIGAVVTLYARESIRHEIPEEKHSFFWGIWLFCLTGLLGITITGDAFNLYVLLEISSLATYTLVAMGKFRERRALTSSINYLVLGTIGASFILLGIGYLYSITGTLNMGDMATRLQEIYATWGTDAPMYKRATVTGFAFLMVGLSLKLALFPLHGWLPNAYTYAPSAVSALLAATATKVGAYIAIRFLYTIVGTGFAFSPEIPTDKLLMVSASLAILIGSFIALRQRNLKRMLAFSSLAQIGYITLGIALANPEGLAGAVVHLFNHALTKGGMFLALGIVVYRMGGSSIDDLRGLGRKLPITMAAFTAGGLGLIGVPLTAGFISKWYLVGGALQAGRPELAIVILVGSVLALAYVWKIVEVIYFQERPDGAVAVREAPLSMTIPTVLLIGASLYFGIDATTSASVAQSAAEALIQGAAR